MNKLLIILLIAATQFISCTGSVETAVNNSESNEQSDVEIVEASDSEIHSKTTESVKKSQKEINLKLVSSRDYFSPGENESDFLSIQLINNTEKNFLIPAYSLQNLTINGQGSSQRFPLSLNIIEYPEISMQNEVNLKPGETIELIRFSFKDLFNEHNFLTSRNRKARWIWDWDAAMMAPPSPIQTGDSFENEAEFWAEMYLNNQEFKSERLLLKVKP